MIRVLRGPAPPSLAGEDSPGGRERAEAINHRGRAVVPPKPGKRPGKAAGFKFKAYKRNDVVEALRTLFRKKCAYCEFGYAPGGPDDIEHFRPKNAVVIDGKLSEPGYYWLGADWNNLLPSCIDCNRRRTLEFDGGRKGLSGKANLFPVADENRRWRDPHNTNDEEPLLLNPCEDEPGEHLEFFGDGLVRAVLDDDGCVSRKGEESIQVFGLQRRDLVEARDRKLKHVRALIEVALKLAETAEATTDAALRAQVDALVRQQRAAVYAHLNADEPFLAATRAVFREYGLPLVE